MLDSLLGSHGIRERFPVRMRSLGPVTGSLSRHNPVMQENRFLQRVAMRMRTISRQCGTTDEHTGASIVKQCDRQLAPRQRYLPRLYPNSVLKCERGDLEARKCVIPECTEEMPFAHLQDPVVRSRGPRVPKGEPTSVSVARGIALLDRNLLYRSPGKASSLGP